MIAGGAGQPDDGVAMDADEAFSLADAVSLGQVMEHGAGRLVGEPAIEQRRPLALGEAGLAGVAVEQADVIPLAVAIADGEIPGVSSPVEGAVGILAAEAGEVVHGIGHPCKRDGTSSSDCGKRCQTFYDRRSPFVQ